MHRNALTLLVLLGLLSCFILGFAQEQPAQEDPLKNPPTLYPEMGPGDKAVVQELQEINRLLREQIQILHEQNKLLRQSLTSREPAPKN